MFGYFWARRNKNHEIVKKASEMSHDEFGYIGGVLLKTIGKKWNRMDGTGF